MLKYLVATPAGITALCLLIGSFLLFSFICWYVAADRRRTRTRRLAAMALDDGQPAPAEADHA